MSRRKGLLLIDVGSEAMHVLASRLQRIEVPTIRVKSTEEAVAALLTPRIDLGGAVIPPDLPVASIGGAIAALRELRETPLPFLVAGTLPGRAERDALRSANIDYALWEPMDAHALRFQVNRAIHGEVPARRERAASRAPASDEVEVRKGRRVKETRLYAVSSQGAYFVTRAPFLRGSEVDFRLPIAGAKGKVRGHVTMTNVPGNLMRRALPPGMAVQFRKASPNLQATLHVYVRRRLNRLDV